uniref:NADH-ubiquinone oxidoreductase chain 2 n=1 Tax=Xystodesmus sp. YD-2016 TaxID=1904352 RepID=A0A1S5RS97_9MYRI|nr:NADH dehydrogenase subunit 2 [Xystodesmus sp. YD-2016]
MWVLLSFVYLMMMGLGTVLALSSSSWFVVWMGLELNMMGFIPFVGVKSNLVSEGIFKYFLVQVVGSLLMFLFGLLGGLVAGYWMFIYDMFFGGGFIMMIMALKMGVSPFHGWFLSLSDELDWVSLIMLLTWQKLAPLGLIIVSGWNMSVALLMGLMSVLVGGFGGLNQLMMKQLMAYSSIGHLGWMSVLVLISWQVGLVYFVFYSVISLGVIVYFLGGHTYVSQFYSKGGSESLMMWSLCLSLFSLGGLPPLLGFYPKWVGVISLLSVSYFWLASLYLMVSLMTLYFYLRLGYMWFLGGMGKSFWLISSSLLGLLGVFIGGLTLGVLPICVFLFG